MEPVLIVGGGPVGLALALVLARHGAHSVVLEARAQPTPRDEARATSWLPRGLELMDWLGLGERLKALGLTRTAHQLRAGNKPLLTLRFDHVHSPRNLSLQLPQHDAEALLEEAALETGLVEVRRGHRLMAVAEQGGLAHVLVQGPAGESMIAARYAVGCDGARSEVREMLGIETRWLDYGMDSAVADFELDCELPTDVSSLELDARRPFGFVCFAPGRWRFIYRLNEGEDPQAMTTEAAATALLLEKLPGARVRRFLWASAFRLRQGQSEHYVRRRWLLAGDAAHAMGPPAEAGMMMGLLGAWRLGWRLALAAGGHREADFLLADYEREQRASAEALQAANGLDLRSFAVTSGAAGWARRVALRLLSRFPSRVLRMTEAEALLHQALPVEDATDAPLAGPWAERASLGGWRVGARVPADVVPRLGPSTRPEGLVHRIVTLRRGPADEEARLAADIQARMRVPARALYLTGAVPARPERPAAAVVRPDQHIVRICEAGG